MGIKSVTGGPCNEVGGLCNAMEGALPSKLLLSSFKVLGQYTGVAFEPEEMVKPPLTTSKDGGRLPPTPGCSGCFSGVVFDDEVCVLLLVVVPNVLRSMVFLIVLI